jgi:hypothetical protein
VLNTLPFGVLRVLAASGACAAITWLIVSPSHVCDSTGDTPLTWLVIFLPTVAGLLVGIRPFSSLVLAMAAFAGSIAMAWVVIAESLADGMVSPSGAQCEPSPGGAILLVPFTCAIVTVLLVVFYAAGIREKTND